VAFTATADSQILKRHKVSLRHDLWGPTCRKVIKLGHVVRNAHRRTVRSAAT
jgi:hypothetical protein